MKSNELLKNLVETHSWETIVSEYTVTEFCNLITFEECKEIADKMFFESFSNADIQNFSIDALLEMKRRNKLQWDKDWKNDLELGDMCFFFRLRLDDMYAAYQDAYNLCPDPPAEVLIALARCYNVPGEPYISPKKAAELLETALTKNASQELLREAKQELQRIYNFREEVALSSRIRNLIGDHNWNELCLRFTAETLGHDRHSQSALSLAYSFFFNLDCFDEPQMHALNSDLQRYAVLILVESQKSATNSWVKDWKNDIVLAYLSLLSGVTHHALPACRRVLSIFEKPIPEVLSLTAYCEGLPWVTDITTEEAKNLCEQAFQMNRSPLAAEKLRQIYAREQNNEQAAYWDSVCKQLAQEGLKEQVILPEVLSDPRITRHLVPYIEKHLTIIAT